MIREAERRDRERIEELYKLLIPDDNEIEVLEDRIDQIKLDPNHYLLVYENEDTVVGTILLSFCPDAMYGNRPYAMLENLIVDPACRGLGVGKQLFDHIEVLCMAVDCREILLMSNVRRTEAHQFFERLGYANVARGFKKYI
ncbi:MAG: GNAT family N-acetyltransferase [Paenibacillaceae bacterium]